MTDDIAYISKLISDSNENNIPVILTKPGCGICNAITETTEASGARVFSVNCAALIDKADLLGTSAFASMATINKMHPTLSDAIEYAENNPDKQPVLIMDSLDMSMPAVITAAARVALTRCFHSMILPENLKIVLMGHEHIDFPEDLGESFTRRLNIYRV